MTQAAQILRLLRRGKRLTPLTALATTGTLSLSQRIGDLKRKGIPIKRRMVEVGDGKHVAQYWIGRGGGR